MLVVKTIKNYSNLVNMNKIDFQKLKNEINWYNLIPNQMYALRFTVFTNASIGEISKAIIFKTLRSM